MLRCVVIASYLMYGAIMLYSALYGSTRSMTFHRSCFLVTLGSRRVRDINLAARQCTSTFSKAVLIHFQAHNSGRQGQI